MNAATALAPLHAPAFRRYLTGQALSITCSWAQVTALAWTVVALDPSALGWVVALQFAPSLVLGPWFGALADRYDRRRIVMLAEAGLGLVAAGYAVAAMTGRLTVPLICVLAGVWGVVNALDTPARQALVPLLVPPGEAASASALAGVVLLLGMTAGSALGAGIGAVAGAAAVFGVNAASFAVDVALLATVRAAASPRVARAAGQMRDGLAYVWRTPHLRAPLLALAVLATLSFTVGVSAPILVSAAFDGGPSLMGLAFTAVTVGGLAGAGVAAARGRAAVRPLPQAATVMAVAMAVTAAAPTVPVLLLGLAGAGFAWSLFIASTIAVLQTAEAALVGRVMSWLGVVLIGGAAAGGPIAGSVAGLAGPRAPFVLGAVAAVAAVAIIRGTDTRTRGEMAWPREARG